MAFESQRRREAGVHVKRCISQSPTKWSDFELVESYVRLREIAGMSASLVPLLSIRVKEVPGAADRVSMSTVNDPVEELGYLTYFSSAVDRFNQSDLKRLPRDKPPQQFISRYYGPAALSRWPVLTVSGRAERHRQSDLPTHHEGQATPCSAFSGCRTAGRTNFSGVVDGLQEHGGHASS
jgi:hypothetical protein